ncbi:putative uncharacterized protein [Pseudarthrobacter siccitolerans]|uniref:Tail terminator n=1 Tax=Pseudarthrobacter siccitolerans TaxID=861266 RepID=A0A024GYF7_9MICC|nr:hypothetical protein [Pseudarthrobacter siccitolerans]CCQ44667.1 putative uncharacterized protein [Pseudarthrobacter siccitolerans]
MAVVFPDPRRAVRDLLKGLLAARSEPYALGVTVSTKAPTSSSSLPFVQVKSDGRFRDSRLNGRATVRVLVYHRDEGLGEDLAALAEALLLESSSPQVRGFSPISGPLPTEDPDTGAPLSFFTITARLTPANL